jgi:cation/acetate symporter
VDPALEPARHLAEDVIVLAAPEIGGLPAVVAYLVAAGGLAAALSTADGLLLTIANAGSHDIYYRLVNPRASAIRRVMLSKVLVLVVALLAAFVATLKLTNILQFVSAAFSLAAAAFFPALTLGIFWRRANAVGATLGMLAGLGVCLYYMSTTMPWLRQLWGVTRPLEDCLWWGISPLSAGVFGVPVGYAVIIVASLLTRPPAPEEVRLIERIRHPEALLDGEAGAA